MNDQYARSITRIINYFAFKMKVCVLGAGIVGLSTAVNLQERFSPADITIIAEKFFSDTTSYVAAGSFRYRSSPQETQNIDLEDRLCRRSFDHYWHLATSESAYDSGVTIVPMLELRDAIEPDTPFYGRFVKSFRRLSQEEILDLGYSSKCKSGYSFLTTMTECKYYLPDLMAKFQRNGGTIVQKKLHSLEDVKSLSLDYKVIVNCTGLGSRHLFSDQELYPVRGQVAVVKAPWIHFALNVIENVYFYPCRDGVVVGGVRQKNDWQTSVRFSDSIDILNRAAEIIPSIRKAEVIVEKVGLRPARSRIRIESEVMLDNDREFLILHNYGHGSHGIALSWGSAMEVGDLLEKFLIRNQMKGRL